MPPLPVIFSILASWVVALVWAATPAPAGFVEGRGAYSARDFETAYAEFSEAAEQGHVRAQLWLGVLYERGQGVGQDHAEAARWYRKAADKGQAVAQYNLGLLYFHGKGVAQNKVEAHKWVSLFLAQRPDSQHAWTLDEFEQDMTTMEIVEAKERAKNWRPSSGN